MVASKSKILLKAALRAQIGTEKAAMEKVEYALLCIGIPLEQIEDIKTMTSEACLNAIEHGYAFDANQQYELELLQEGAEIVLRVRNRSSGTNPAFAYVLHQIDEVMAGLGDCRGWGMVMIDALSDSWTFTEDGDKAVLEIRVGIPLWGRDWCCREL